MKLRPATIEDAQILFDWRNDPLTRESSISTDPVAWDDHVRWLEASLSNPNRELLVAEIDGVPVGTVRLDDGVELSWTVAPSQRGKGIGKQMVSLVERGSIARIKRSNVASQRIAGAAGFVLAEDGEVQEWVRSQSARASDTLQARRSVA